MFSCYFCIPHWDIQMSHGPVSFSGYVSTLKVAEASAVSTDE